MPVGAPTVRRGAAHGRRDLPRAEERSSQEAGHNTAVGDEGGFAPNLRRPTRRSSYLKAIEKAGYKPGEDVCWRSTPASPSSSRTASTSSKARARRSMPTSMVEFYADLVQRYPIVSIEDGMAEDDWDGWKALTDKLGEQVQLVGDDLFVTNAERLARGHQGRARQRDPDQGQPDRHADRDARRHRDGAPRAATARSCRTARARPRTRRSPTSPSPPTAGRSRPARCRAPTASPSTTSCCASRRSSAPQARYAGTSILRGR